MVNMTLLPRSRPLTRADLDAMPDDGHRYELIDGVLVVTPAPSIRHQTLSLSLVLQLERACPTDLTLLYAPVDIVLADDTVLQPDILVACSDDFTDRCLPVAPLLAVEILSPSTRRVDLTLKMSRYEAAGTKSYWIVDPDTPSLTVWELVNHSYMQIAQVSGDEAWPASAPFPITIVPGSLRR